MNNKFQKSKTFVSEQQNIFVTVEVWSSELFKISSICSAHSAYTGRKCLFEDRTTIKEFVPFKNFLTFHFCPKPVFWQVLYVNFFIFLFAQSGQTFSAPQPVALSEHRHETSWSWRGTSIYIDEIPHINLFCTLWNVFFNLKPCTVSKTLKFWNESAQSCSHFCLDPCCPDPTFF